MEYLFKKPTPPTGYKMLEEEKDLTSMYDLVWIIDERRSKNGYFPQRWSHAIMETEEGIKVFSDTNKKYIEPKKAEDYCFFRCKKV
jgi:hypothetical protein